MANTLPDRNERRTDSRGSSLLCDPVAVSDDRVSVATQRVEQYTTQWYILITLTFHRIWQNQVQEYSRRRGSPGEREPPKSPTPTCVKQRRSWRSARAATSAETSGKSGSTGTRSAVSSSTGSGISGCSCTCSRRATGRTSTIASCVVSRRLPVTMATRRPPTSRGCWR